MIRVGSIQMADPSRANFNDATSVDDLRALSQLPRLRALQCSEPVRDAMWRQINEVFCVVRPDVEIRVYGHYSSACDLTFVRLLPDVRRFAADCLRQVSGIEALSELPDLESLSLGILELKDFSVLDRLPPGLKSLSLGNTRSQRPTLAPLRRFQSLRALYLEGHSKDIDVLSELSDLEDLTLRSISTPDLRYLAPLRKLWSLDIKLGGIGQFSGIEGKESIKYLELWQVRELRDVCVISTLTGLQDLFLQSLPHIEAFPPVAGCKALRRILLDNMKGLGDFTALAAAPALEEFAITTANKQTPRQILPVLKNPSVRRVCGYFGSDSKNNEFVRLRDEHGKDDFNRSEPFSYR